MFETLISESFQQLLLPIDQAKFKRLDLFAFRADDVMMVMTAHTVTDFVVGHALGEVAFFE